MSSSNDESSTFVLELPEPRTMDSVWRTKLRDASFLRFFPNKADEFLKRGEVRTHPRGSVVVSGQAGLEFLLIPLSIPLQIKVSSQSIGLDKVIESALPNELIGFREVIEGVDFPFMIQTVNSSAAIFSIKRADFLSLFSDPADLKKIALLTSSKSLFHFFHWLMDNGVELGAVYELMSSPIEHIKIEKFAPIQLKAKSLIFIEDGILSAESLSREESIKIRLHRGHWLGGSYFPEGAQKKFDFKVEETVTLLLIDVQILMMHLPQFVLGKMISEPVVMSIVSKFDTAVDIAELDNIIENRSLSQLDWYIDEDIIRKTTERASFAFTNLWNLLVFLEHTVNEKQILALANAKSFLNLGSTAQILEDLGFVCNVIRIPSKTNYRPLIPLVHYALRRPLLVLDVAAKYVVCMDPEFGVVKYPRAYFEGIGMHYFLEVSESHIKTITRKTATVSQLKPEVAGKMLLKHFFSLNRDDFRNVYIFRLFQSVAVLAVPAYLIGLINQTVGLSKMDHLATYIIGLGLFLVFQVTAIFSYNYYSHSISAAFKTKIQPFFFRLFLQQSSNHITSIKSGMIRSRLQLVDFMLSGFRANQVDIKQYLLTLIVCLLTIGFFVPQAGVILFIFALVGIISVAFMRRNGDSEEINASQLRQELNDLSTDLIKGFESIKIGRAEKWMQEKIINKSTSVARSTLVHVKANSNYNFVGRAIFQMGITAALFVAIDESLKMNVSPHSAIVLTLFFNYSMGPFLGLLNVFFNFQMQGLYSAAGQFMRLDSSEQTKTLKVVSLEGNIRFDKVNFRYSEKLPLVLSDISFTISEGETIAIVGPSGSGKSTLARLIGKMSEPTGGKIFYDEVDARLINPASFLSQVGFVAQTPTLFSGTIAENISLSDDVLDSESILKAATLCGANNFIEKLPGGYSYKLKEGGRGLSGGERQLIAMARMYYSEPQIIVLDEATAYLDKITEKSVSDSLSKAAKKTIVYVVQNISIAKKADRILVVKQGRVIESGNHNQLLSLNGEYAELYRNQVGFN